MSEGASINLKTNTGKNAYSLAFENNHQEVIDILKPAGIEEITLKYMDIPGDIYFGLKKPGLTTQIFAPGIITTDLGEHGSLAISPNMDEIYWQAGGIKYIKNVEGKWTFPDTLELFQRYRANNPCFSADGKKLFFHSKMSLEKDGTFKDSDLWFVSRTNNGWSEPENLGTNLNSEYNEVSPSVAKNGNIYFAVNNDIYRSVFKQGQYQPKEKLGSQISTEHRESSPFIAPDESYIIFETTRPGGIAAGNLYISYWKKNDSWSQPIIMGEDINKGNGRFPSVSPDGKYLFFISLRTGWLDIYWVSAKVIEALKPIN